MDCNSAGETRFDVEWWNPDTPAWETLFPSAPGTERRPRLAFDAADLVDRGARPEVLTFDPGSRIRVKGADEIPTGGTAPSGAVVHLVGRS